MAPTCIRQPSRLLVSSSWRQQQEQGTLSLPQLCLDHISTYAMDGYPSYVNMKCSFLMQWLHLAPMLSERVKSELHLSNRLLPGTKDDQMRTVLLQMRSLTEAALLLQSGGPVALISSLDDTLPRLQPVEADVNPVLRPPGGKQLDLKAVLPLMQTPDKLMAMLGSLQLLHAVLPLHHWPSNNHARQGRVKSNNLTATAQSIAAQVHGAGGLQVLERALRVAMGAMQACESDLAWAVRGGDAQDDLERMRYYKHAVALMAAAAGAVSELLAGLDGRAVHSTGLLHALTTAHVEVCTTHEGLAACIGDGKGSEQLMKARHALAVALACWARNDWQPDAIPALLGVYPSRSKLQQQQLDAGSAADRGHGSARAPAVVPAYGPVEMLGCLLALGDVAPSEWPAAGASERIIRLLERQTQAGKAPPATVAGFDAPTHMVLRGTIARGFENQMEPLKRAVAFGISSESRVVRCALVRMCAKASGLGGGMAPFLAPLILEELNVVMRGATSGGGTTLSDGRRVVEIILTLASKPAMKVGGACCVLFVGSSCYHGLVYETVFAVLCMP